MMMRGWLQEVDAKLRRDEPLWRETGDGHGTTLVVTDAGLRAIGIEPVVVRTVVAIREHAAKTPAPKDPAATQPKLRAGTKQAQVIAMVQRPEGATIVEIVAATAWQPHPARGVISRVLKKKLGLDVSSEKDDVRWALLHKSLDGRGSPFPGQTHPTTSVIGVPSAVKPFSTAMRIWNSAT